ncbi:AAA-domain-containing protein [Fistulina hepatica ATCC 64428]|nr:AAA-domain-containing protein [Fistulina hepatica ATCC 64428]
MVDEPMPADATESTKWVVHVEVRLQANATMRFGTISRIVQDFISSSFDRISLPSKLEGWGELPELAAAVENIAACECACPERSLPVEDIDLEIHVYQPSDTQSFDEFSTATSPDDEDDTNAATVCELPNRSWEGLWDSLIYADGIKLNLLDYIYATLVLSDADINLNLVSWNRVILLHGPPGTGKTSLCRALAQKLSIRLSHRFSQSRLLEINSHSLFSKWFSESGKLVQRLFNSITELADEEDAFLVVLIDEVESLTAARAGAMAGTEPSDGLRVVNALLTQLDKLKHRKNVLIMSTSNLVKAIDSAFLDRADVIQYIDLPPREAVYDILRSALCEMIKKGIVSNDVPIPTLEEAQMYEISEPQQREAPWPATVKGDEGVRRTTVALRLLALATTCKAHALSGRALRRLPVLALARYVSVGKRAATSNSGDTMQNGTGRVKKTTMAPVDVEVWLSGLEDVVSKQMTELQRFS